MPLKFVRKITEYLKKLIDSVDPTSMTRFLEMNVVMATLFAWIIQSIFHGKMVDIPESVLGFNALLVGGKLVKDIWNKVREEL